MKRKAIVSAVLTLGILVIGVSLGGCSNSDGKGSSLDLKLSADPPVFDEGLLAAVELTAVHVGKPASYAWKQIAGPKVPLVEKSAEQAIAYVGAVSVAVDTELVFELALAGKVEKRERVSVLARAVDALSMSGPKAQIGGSALAGVAFFDGEKSWIVHGVGARLEAHELAAVVAPPGPRPGPTLGPDVVGMTPYPDRPKPTECRDHGGCPWVPPTADPTGFAAADPMPAITHPDGCPWCPPSAVPTGHQPDGSLGIVSHVGPLGAIDVGALIRDVELVRYQDRPYALLALGAEGIGVVDLGRPDGMKLVRTVPINFVQRDVAWTDATGVIRPGNDLESARGPVVALATDGRSLWIADGGFGIHRTSLAALLGVDPMLEPDGTLYLEQDLFTLHFAGETPWGAPEDLLLHRGYLFAALGVAGIAVYEADTLDAVGRYNLYNDAAVAEDWFVRREPALEVVRGGLDPVTGLPTPVQASHEILATWLDDSGDPTPWTDLVTQGQYYYDAKAIDVVDEGGISIAYVAYGLAGLVALDVTGYAEAVPWTRPIVPRYLGYLPAVPAAAPKTYLGPPTGAIVPQEDHDALSRAGVTGVRVVDGVAWYADDRAGIVAVEGALRPEVDWRGPQRYYDNDDISLGEGVMGDHQPPWEWVTSFDLSGYDPEDVGSVPAWMSEWRGPCLGFSGSEAGAGTGLVVLPGFDPGAAGRADIAQLAGPDGMKLIDASRAGDKLALDGCGGCATTAEIGVGHDYTACWNASLGLAQAVHASDGALYVADGPHGVLAWRTVDAAGFPVDELHLVGNTAQGCEPIRGPHAAVFPAYHACGLAPELESGSLYGLCADQGLRRMDVSPIETGLATVGDPAMIDVHAPGVFELPQRAGEAYGAVLRNGVAFVADGRNGLVAYDLSNRDVPSPVLGTLGGLGVATAVALWDEPAQGGTVAFVATGPSGIAVVDVTNPAAMRLVWKSVSSMALGTTGSTPWNGSVVDVAVEGDRVWFSHAPGGVLLYEAAELLHARTPQAAASFRLQDQPGHADAVGVPRGLFVHRNGAATTLLVAYDDSGVAVVDWTNARDPRLQRLLPTAGSCRDVAVCDGRVYVADFEGGLAAFR